MIQAAMLSGRVGGRWLWLNPNPPLAAPRSALQLLARCAAALPAYGADGFCACEANAPAAAGAAGALQLLLALAADADFVENNRCARVLRWVARREWLAARHGTSKAAESAVIRGG